MKPKAYLRKPLFFMFLIPLLAMQANSQQLVQPEKAIFNGSARFISHFYEPSLPQSSSPSDGDECSFVVSGKKMLGEWSGHGFWEDQNWYLGALKAVFTIGDGNVFKDPNPQNPDIFLLHGKADVFISGEYVGALLLFLELCESNNKKGDWVRFYLFSPELPQNTPPWSDPLTNCYYWSSSGNGLVNGGIRAKVIKW